MERATTWHQDINAIALTYLQDRTVRLLWMYANPDLVTMAEIVQLTIRMVPFFVLARLVLQDCNANETLMIVRQLPVSTIPSVLI